MEKRKELLFICPTFFGYYRDLSKIFEDCGYSVSFFNDRPSENFLTKVMLRLNKKSLSNKVDKYVSNILKSVDGKKIDLVFILLGQCFSRKHIVRIKEAHPEAEFVYYTWDSVSNFPTILEMEDLFDRIYSFDDDDCKMHGYTLLPLFYCNNPQETDIEYICSSVLTVKKGKLDNYKKIKASLPKAIKKANMFEYLYIQSKSVYLYYRLHLKEFKNSKMCDFKYRKMDRFTYFNLLDRSKVVIDCQMKDQVGLTMRTFEALHAHKKIVTTNENIKNYDFYTPDNIFIVNKTNKKVPLSFFEQPFNAKFNLDEKYSISNFVSIIIRGEN